MRRLLVLTLAIAMCIAGSTASADIPISGLPSVSSVAPADVVPCVHSGTTSKCTATQLWNPTGPIVFLGAGAVGASSQTYIAQDAQTPAGMIFNMPSSSVYGFQWEANASPTNLMTLNAAGNLTTLGSITPKGAVILSTGGAGLMTSSVGFVNDGAATNGMDLNVPSGSTNGFQFQFAGVSQFKVLTGSVVSTVPLSLGTTYENIGQGSASTAGDLGIGRSSSQGLMIVGGSQGIFDYGVTTSSIFHFDHTVASSGALIAGAATAAATSAGDLAASRSTTTGIEELGGSSSSGSLDWNITTTNAFTLYRAGTGYANISGGAYTNASDRRWKKDIRPLAPSCAAIMALKPVAFRWRSDGHDDIGFIAQDVQHVLPAITHADGHGYLGVEYANITAPLTSCIQQQQSAISELQDQVRALRLRGIIHITEPRTPLVGSFIDRVRWLVTGYAPGA